MNTSKNTKKNNSTGYIIQKQAISLLNRLKKQQKRLYFQVILLSLRSLSVKIHTYYQKYVYEQPLERDMKISPVP